MKKKKLITIIVVLIICLFLGGITYVSVHKLPQESKWNVCIRVENVSQSGLTLYMERTDENDEAPVLRTGEPFALERWTIFGWQTMKMNDGFAFDHVAYPMEQEFAKSWSIDLEGYYGKLPKGLYRISKSAVLADSDEEKETYYATFEITD